MPDETRDWSGWAMQLAVHPESGTDDQGRPRGWRVIAPGSGGTPEEAANYAAWERWLHKNLPQYPERWMGNGFAASVGWPLPEPQAGTDGLDLRPYDRQRFPAGRIITDRREAAILAPGDFPDVDTSVEPPQFYVDTLVNEPIPEGESSAATPAPSSLTRRVPKVGDRVVILPAGDFIEGPVTAVLTTDEGDVSNCVRVGTTFWGYVVGWLA